MLSLAAAMIRINPVVLLTLMSCGGAVALEPLELLVMANKDVAESMGITQYCCGQRVYRTEFCSRYLEEVRVLWIQSAGRITKRSLQGGDTPEVLHSQATARNKCLLKIYGVPISA
jgi:hypothetical protein